MNRREAEKIYDSGKEPSVAKLLEYDFEVKQLKRKIGQLERNSKDSSKPPSSDNPRDKNPKKETQKSNDDKRKLASKLLKRFDHLFTFVYYEGVEPTNNLAERAIRAAVQWRKICFGNRSDNGAVLTSRLLTVTRTCWLQERNPLEYLVDAIIAHRTGNPAPLLL